MHHPSSTRQQAASLCVSPTVPAEAVDAGQRDRGCRKEDHRERTRVLPSLQGRMW